MEITNQQQYMAATRSLGTSIVKCSTAWCKPCKLVHPAYVALAAKYQSVRFYTMDVESVPNFPESGLVTSVPTFLLFKNNELSIVRGANIKAVEDALLQKIQG